jgi:hypothetical protein
LFRTLEFLSARQRLRRHLTHVGERGNAVGRIAAQTISDRAAIRDCAAVFQQQ